MKRFSTGFLIAVFMFAPVMAEEVPFATAPYDRDPSESAVGTLANIMENIQLRHIKFLLADKPLRDLMEAAKKKDYSLYAKAFDELTAGCNSCHVAGQVAYIKIQVPKSFPFSDQSYER